MLKRQEFTGWGRVFSCVAGKSSRHHSPTILFVFSSFVFSWRIMPEPFTKINCSRILFYLQGTCSAVRTTCSSYTEYIMQLIPTCHILGALRTQQTENIFLFVFSFFLDNKCKRSDMHLQLQVVIYWLMDKCSKTFLLEHWILKLLRIFSLVIGHNVVVMATSNNQIARMICLKAVTVVSIEKSTCDF